MTDNELRVAIALLLGWTWDQPFNRRKQSNRLNAPDKRGFVTIWKRGPMGGEDAMPNWPCDLNAMHEAEKAIAGDIDKFRRYQAQLAIVMDCEDYNPEYQFLWHATARQRALAFVQTITKP